MEYLVETTYPRLQVTEAAGKPMVISGVAGMANKRNANGRVYKREILAREIARMNEELSQSNRAGAVDHPNDAPGVSDLGLKFRRLWMDGDAVHFEAEIIETQKGKDLAAVVKAGIAVGISSRGYGSVKVDEWEGEPAAIIGEDYELCSWDAVVTPSVANARILSFEEELTQTVERLAAEGPLASIVTEATWTKAYQDSLPDGSFAYIAPGGHKDSEGKTTPRSLRHLPYKDKNGKPDAAHVRNALSRLPQTSIPASAKASAKKKLLAAAKDLGIEVATESVESPHVDSVTATAPHDPQREMNTQELILRSQEMIERLEAEEAGEAVAAATAESAVTEPDVPVVEEAASAAAPTEDEQVVEAEEQAAPLAEAEAEPVAEAATPTVEAEADDIAPHADLVSEDHVAALTTRLNAALTREAQATLERDQAVTRQRQAEQERQRLQDDVNISLALVALTNAINAEVQEGDWSTLSRLASIASDLDFCNMLDDMSEGGDAQDGPASPYEALRTPAAWTRVEALTAPLRATMQRALRDEVAYTLTKDERYGRRLFAILRERCQTPQAVEEAFPLAKAEVERELTGKLPLPMRGKLTVDERDRLTPQQREMRRLAGIR